MQRPESKLECWLLISMYAFAAMLPFSISLVQPPAYMAALLSLALLWHRRRCAAVKPFFQDALLVFLAVALIASLVGSDPSRSVEKMNRFLVLTIAWGIPMLLITRERSGGRELHQMAVCFMAGLSIKAGFDMVRVPVEVAMGTPLFNTGTMRDPQFYLVGACLAVGMVSMRAWNIHYPPTLVATLFSLVGLLLHFKRGSWIAFVGAMAVMGVASRRWRSLVIAFLVLCSSLLLPPVRERLAELGDEFGNKPGGRLVLWTEVAPSLIPEYPFGMGWKAARHEDFIAINADVEPGLDHLHNNALQVLLELGWAGLLVWLYWMGLVVVAFWRSFRRCSDQDRMYQGLALGGLGAFSGLMLNGMVEYNFGDSEIFMLMVFLMTIASILVNRVEARRPVDVSS